MRDAYQLSSDTKGHTQDLKISRLCQLTDGSERSMSDQIRGDIIDSHVSGDHTGEIVLKAEVQFMRLL